MHEPRDPSAAAPPPPPPTVPLHPPVPVTEPPASVPVTAPPASVPVTAPPAPGADDVALAPGAPGAPRGRRLVVAGVVAALAVVAGVIGVTRGGGGGGDAGVSTGDAGPGALQGEVAWETKLGFGASTPTVVARSEAVVVLGATGRSGERTAPLAAVDRADGHVLWEKQVPAADLSLGTRRAVAADRAVLYGELRREEVGGKTSFVGAVVSVDERTGAERWRLDDLSDGRGWLAIDRLVIGVQRSSVVAVSAQDGREAWSFDIAADATNSVQLLVARANGLVVHSSVGRTSELIGLDLQGRERWRVGVPARPTSIADWRPEQTATVVPIGVGADVLGVDLESGGVRWTAEDRWSEKDGSRSALLVPEGEETVVVCAVHDTDATLAALALDTGRERWTTKLAPSSGGLVGLAGDLVLTSDRVTTAATRCGGESPAVRDIEARSSASGTVVWKYDADKPQIIVQYHRPLDFMAEPRLAIDGIVDTTGDSNTRIDAEQGDTAQTVPDASGVLVHAGRTVLVLGGGKALRISEPSGAELAAFDAAGSLAGWVPGTLWVWTTDGVLHAVR